MDAKALAALWLIYCDFLLGLAGKLAGRVLALHQQAEDREQGAVRVRRSDAGRVAAVRWPVLLRRIVVRG